MTYARDTTVSIQQTRNDIENTLQRYGADGFAYANQADLAVIMFNLNSRTVTGPAPPSPGNSRSRSQQRNG